jgi:uncharacterized membrane protein (GlpM family)
MQFALKLLVSNLVIISCAVAGRKHPSLSGLIATMPLTSLIVLFWLYQDAPGDHRLMAAYTRGVFWGILPTILFFGTAWFCFRKGLPLSATIGAAFGVWLAGAAVHQWILG